MKAKAIALFKCYFGFTYKEAENYYKTAKSNGTLKNKIDLIEEYYRIQAKYD